jgi:hypothetical protein
VLYMLEPAASEGWAACGSFGKDSGQDCTPLHLILLVGSLSRGKSVSTGKHLHQSLPLLAPYHPSLQVTSEREYESRLALFGNSEDPEERDRGTTFGIGSVQVGGACVLA